MATHELKTDPTPFKAVWQRKKTFELLKNDRNFQIGDFLQLREYDADAYTGRVIWAEVMYIQIVLENLCVMSIKVIQRDKGTQVR